MKQPNTNHYGWTAVIILIVFNSLLLPPAVIALALAGTYYHWYRRDKKYKQYRRSQHTELRMQERGTPE